MLLENIRGEISEDDGGRLYYINKGEKKSIRSDEFERKHLLGQPKYQRLLTILYNSVGSVEEITKKYTDNEQKQHRGMHRKETEHKILSMLSNLMTAGFSKPVTDSGAEGGTYYTITEEGIEYFVQFLLKRIPDIYKETSLKFIKRKRDQNDVYVMPSFYLLMMIASMRGLDPMLVCVKSGEKPISAKKLFDSFIEYDIKVNQIDKSVANDESYIQKLKHRMRKLMDQKLIQMTTRENTMFFQLTELGERYISPVTEMYQRYVQSIDRIPIIDMVNNHQRRQFILTPIGVAIRKKYKKKKSRRLEAEKQFSDITMPPMPINEEDEEKPIRFTLKKITDGRYRVLAWIRFKRAFKSTTIEAKLGFISIILVFVAVCSFFLGVIDYGIYFTIAAFVVLILIFFIKFIKTLRLPKMKTFN